MCLGVPAKVLSTGAPENPLSMGAVDMAGEERPCCFAYLPEVTPGQWVLVQNSFAMTVLSEADAAAALAALAEFDLIASPHQITPE